MNLKCHTKELKGIGGMAIFNLLCKLAVKSDKVVPLG